MSVVVSLPLHLAGADVAFVALLGHSLTSVEELLSLGGELLLHSEEANFSAGPQKLFASSVKGENALNYNMS